MCIRDSTGTPLLKEERASCKVFGNYLHTYYYDKSIYCAVDEDFLKVLQVPSTDRQAEPNVVQKRREVVVNERFVQLLKKQDTPSAFNSAIALFPSNSASAFWICPKNLPYFGPTVRSCGLKV